MKRGSALTDPRTERCFPLTVLGDCSRFLVCLKAYYGETGEHAKQVLTDVLRRYGLTEKIICENGNSGELKVERDHKKSNRG